MLNQEQILALRERIRALNPAQQESFKKKLMAQGIPWESIVEEVSVNETSINEAIPRQEFLPLSPSQLKLWVLQQL